MRYEEIREEIRAGTAARTLPAWAARVLDVPIHNSTSTVRDLWPDGQEREFTFIYSVCGCPVKARARRVGETTARTTELPVMFPDDPAAMKVINSLMGWTKVPSP